MATLHRLELEFYFDFMSPFAYLAHQRLPNLVSRYGLELVYKVVDLPTLKRAAGNTGPRNIDIPPKIRYLKTDLARWANAYGVPLAFPPNLRSERINKGVFYAADRGATADYVRVAWTLAWGSGEDMDGEDTLLQCCRAFAWDFTDFLAFIESGEAESRYQANNKEAEAKGVFGVPIMLVGNQMWWGNDRLDFLEQYLRENCARAM